MQGLDHNRPYRLDRFYFENKKLLKLLCIYNRSLG